MNVYTIKEYKIKKDHSSQEWPYWMIVAKISNGVKTLYVTSKVKQKAEKKEIDAELKYMLKLATQSGGREGISMRLWYHV